MEQKMENMLIANQTTKELKITNYKL
jgi:hypothetical protein